MRRVSLLAFAMISLAGCQGSEPQGTTPAPEPVVVQPGKVETPGTTDPTKIALVVRKGPAITVGLEHPEKAFAEFHDNKHSGSEYNDLPPNFDSNYKARSYETSHMGFGEILYCGDPNKPLLVAAMYQEDHVDQDRVDQLRADHTEQVGMLPTPFLGKKVSYWFWELGHQRLMICSFQDGKQGIKVTVAMGDDKVMDGLGVTMDKAQKDKDIIDAASIKAAGQLVPHT